MLTLGPDGGLLRGRKSKSGSAGIGSYWQRVETRTGGYLTVLPTGQAHEYFLVENRTQAGFDRFLPDSGARLSSTTSACTWS